MNPGLGGRMALVTGANHGIGAAIVHALAGQGAHLSDVFPVRAEQPAAPACPTSFR
jgi:NAD(P)-dependent dehydrogenase (short-subunit alcohol dehydrogenase family)